MQSRDLGRELFRRIVPDAVGQTIYMAWPKHAAGIALDGAVAHQFHRADAQLVVRLLAQGRHAGNDLFGGGPNALQGRHQPDRKFFRSGDRHQGIHSLLGQRGQQVGCGGHADAAGDAGVIAHRVVRLAKGEKIQFKPPLNRELRRQFGQLARWRAVVETDNSLDVRVCIVSHHFQRVAVHGRHMAVGMQDQDRAVRRDLIEMTAVQPITVQKDRIEAPGEKRRLGRQPGKRPSKG